MYEKVIPGIRFRSTRDCPYACPFCIIQPSEARGYDRRSFQMSPERTVNEIEHVVNRYHLKGVFFWDETFTINQKRTMAICDEIIKRKLKFTWRCLTRVDTLNQPLLERMYEAGCRHIEFGLESGDQAVRTHLQKNFPDEKAIEVIGWTRKAGISANCDFIVGMPWETKETLEKTIDHSAFLGKPTSPTLTPTLSLPGQSLFLQLFSSTPGGRGQLTDCINSIRRYQFYQGFQD